ncbi:MAG: hypothetical protein ACI89D_000092 [Bermanella sp.]|jgi:hypothetical protein
MRPLLIGFLLLGGVTVAGAGDCSASAALDKISHQIAYINTFGRWSEGAMVGSYRVILMDAKEDYPHSKIYLQWVKQSNADEDAVVVAVAPVVEINNAGVYTLSAPRIVQLDDRIVV